MDSLKILFINHQIINFCKGDFNLHLEEIRKYFSSIVLKGTLQDENN